MALSCRRPRKNGAQGGRGRERHASAGKPCPLVPVPRRGQQLLLGPGHIAPPAAGSGCSAGRFRRPCIVAGRLVSSEQACLRAQPRPLASMRSACSACSCWRRAWRCPAGPASRWSSPACPAPPTPSWAPGSCRRAGGQLAVPGAAGWQRHSARLVAPSCARAAALARPPGFPASRRPKRALLLLRVQGDTSLLGALAAEVLLPGVRVGMPEDLAAQPTGAMPASAAKATSPAGGGPPCNVRA